MVRHVLSLVRVKFYEYDSNQICISHSMNKNDDPHLNNLHLKYFKMICASSSMRESLHCELTKTTKM